MPDVLVKAGAHVKKCIVAEGMKIPEGVKLGSDDKIELIARKGQVK